MFKFVLLIIISSIRLSRLEYLFFEFTASSNAGLHGPILVTWVQ